MLAYPLNRRIGPSGEVLARKAWAFDTFGVTDYLERLSLSIREMSAGNMVYGLYRVPLLARAGVYRRVLVPDRLLMTELAVYGQFKQVPEVLWFRRWYGRIFSLGRQRKSFFPGGRPLYMYAPWWISHGVSLFWTFGVKGQGLPAVSPTAGKVLGLKYLVFSGLFHVWQTLRALADRSARACGPVEALRTPAETDGARDPPPAVSSTGLADHLKPYVGAKARKPTCRGRRRSVKQGAFEAVRRPGLALAARCCERFPSCASGSFPRCSSTNSIRSRQHRSSPRCTGISIVSARPSGPIIIGPWISEVGFEVLYWVPFLNWAIKAFGLDPVA